MFPRFLFSCLVAWAALHAQEAARAIPPETTFRTDTRLVVLNVSVLDKEGKIVKGIPRSAFTVYKNDEKQEIKVFRQEDVPVSLGLTIDNSASMRGKRERVASAALALVRASNPQDEVFIMKFNERPVLSKDFTSDVKELEKGLRDIEATGETAMRDALRLGIEHLRDSGKRDSGKKDKKVLLVVTDGEDNSSVETLDHVVQAAHRQDVIVYAIGLLGTEEPTSAERAKKQLERLTAATGGRAWFPDSIDEIARITPEIAHEIRNQYVIAYTPANAAVDGGFRKVRVEANVPGVTVHTRSGYYAGRR